MNEESSSLHVVYTEIFPGADDWVNSDTPSEGNVMVTREGLKKLLNLAAEVWPFAMGGYLALRGKVEDAKGMYPQIFDADHLVKMMNASSSVFCEGSLIVSGLFVDDNGKPIVHLTENVTDTQGEQG